MTQNFYLNKDDVIVVHYIEENFDLDTMNYISNGLKAAFPKQKVVYLPYGIEITNIMSQTNNNICIDTVKW